MVFLGCFLFSISFIKGFEMQSIKKKIDSKSFFIFLFNPSLTLSLFYRKTKWNKQVKFYYLEWL